MRHPRILGVLVLSALATLAAPLSGRAQDVQSGTRDSLTTARVKIAIFADERVAGWPIRIEADAGTITLRGTVSSAEAKAAAGGIAKAIEGVRGVRNELQVAPPASAGGGRAGEPSDGDITAAIRDRFLRDAPLRDIGVRASGGAVVLTGAVPTIAASARASERARGVPGVRSVKNELTYEASALDRPGRPEPVSSGARAQVMAMQQALKDKGFDPGPIDGEGGPQTTAALLAYQRSESLKPTGKLDSATAARLARAGSPRRTP